MVVANGSLVGCRPRIGRKPDALPNRAAGGGVLVRDVTLGRPFLQEQRVNVGVVEKLTGLKFFTALPADKRAALVDKCETSQLWAAAAPKKKKKPH